MKENHFKELCDLRNDPWNFLIRRAKTLDPVLGIARYPDWPHLQKLANHLIAHRRLLVVKSRQMMATWTSLGILLHKAIFGPPGVYLLMSRNERSARELLDRIRFLIAGLPTWFRPHIGTNSASELAFDQNRTRILSLPATPDTPRMHSPAGVIWDEMAFTPNSEEIWTALKPALDSGGFFWGISSSGGPGNIFAELAKESHLHGLKTFWLHYSDHPNRGDEWVKEAKKGLSPSRWAREYEISFEIAEDRVYSDFLQRTHVLLESYRPQQHLPVFRSVDFGYYHPVVLWIQKTSDDRIIVFDEWIGDQATVNELVEAIHAKDRLYGLSEREVEWTSCDPAGHSPGESGVSPIERLKRAGIKIKARPSRIDEGVDLVRELLKERDGLPALMVSPEAGKVITDFNGYRMRPDGEAPEKDNIHDHTMDALRYFVVNWLGANRKRINKAARVKGIN